MLLDQGLQVIGILFDKTVQYLPVNLDGVRFLDIKVDQKGIILIVDCRPATNLIDKNFVVKVFNFTTGRSLIIEFPTILFEIKK